jgi:hypothetical protein
MVGRMSTAASTRGARTLRQTLSRHASVAVAAVRACTALLLAAGIEAAIEPANPIWGHGGWSVVTIAMAIVAIEALALRGAQVAVELLARRRGASPRGGPFKPAVRRLGLAVAPWRQPPALACHLSERAPPLRI